MSTTRKFAMSLAGTVAGIAGATLAIIPATALANSPWDSPSPNTYVANSPWDSIGIHATGDNSPWD